MNAMEEIVVENHKAVLGSMEVANGLAKSTQDVLVAELANVEAKQAEAIKAIANQIADTSKDSQEKVVELFAVHGKHLQEQIGVEGNIISKLEKINSTNDNIIRSIQRVSVFDKNKESDSHNLLALEKMVKENKVTIVNGFNNLNKRSNEIVNEIGKLDKGTIEQLMQIDESIRFLLINNLMDDLEKCGSHKK